MSEMEVSTEGNGPSEDHLEVPSPPAVESNAKNTTEKVSPEEMCRQLSTAFKEIEVIDSIVENSKRSDLQQDYVQINETLLQKRKFLEEWVSRYHCPIESCKLHNSPKNLVNNVNHTVNNNVNNVVNCNSGKSVNASISRKVNVKPVVNSNSSKHVTLANASNSGKVIGNVKPKTKRNASQISSNINDSGEFRTPNKN
ncbi:hypothetical protein CEXT_659271 [Caerostris extrusa]|uniref:Uncharacterized protein n=1 Tax=Caerostris extrusa TaxID=172846 RepID=A0AAV4V5W2_CAEEX|nr:hypothetical protein CEXT_659271 [Caerostris extrusa]